MDIKNQLPTEYTNLTVGSIRKKEKSGVFMLDYRLKTSNGTIIKHSSKSFKREKDAKAFLEKLKTTHGIEMYKLDNPETTMTFSDLYERYKVSRLKDKPSTKANRKSLVQSRIMPFWSNIMLGSITRDTVAQWHATFYQDGVPIYSDTYLRSLHSRLSAILNYAVECGWMSSNPAKRCSIGEKNGPEQPVWSPEEYSIFRNVMQEKPIAFYAFETLYLTGLRKGELLALTIADLDLENRELNIYKSLQRIKSKDVITSPKTKKSVRKVKLSKILCDELKEYVDSLPDNSPSCRLFPITPYFLRRNLKWGIKETELHPITIHGFRHSHITNLCHAGFAAVDIAKRVGHESIYITLHYSHAIDSIADVMADAIDKQMEGMN